MFLILIWKSVFDKYDTDGNGRIPIGAFRRRIMEANERLEEDIPREVLDEIIERVEWDHDGYISYSEFISMVKSREMGAHRPI
ncbi:uncharacterized protein LOC128391063 isoform X2 [Panonychus citri]|uniref:uncharacterized protein LOC128391063 isoform X2 n=1 Tax=Panonychus citri TaxID=50023 RepID=UPI002307D276|nr:uncharacterized protein LOC128391063 isoform X2 [Panonychus citri]